MAQQKIIAVVGATGAQGGGLVRAILADPNGGFKIRAITRDVTTDKARELAALGAEVVAGDVDDVGMVRERDVLGRPRDVRQSQHSDQQASPGLHALPL